MTTLVVPTRLWSKAAALLARSRSWVAGLWWRTRGQLLIVSANFLVATSAALTTAVLALVIEDLLPARPPVHLALARATLLAATLVLLFTAISWRAAVHRRTGTLFYVRLLDDQMPDWQQTPLAVARRGRMSLKSVTRWVDFGAHTRDGVIDLVTTCQEMATALEATINSDRDDTAYTIAPNVLWPVALAIGAELPVVDELRLLELPGGQAAPAPGAAELSFRLTDPPGPDALVISEKLAHPAPTPTHHPATSAHPDQPVHPATPDAPVGLILAFTPLAATMSPGVIFADRQISECYRLRPRDAADLARIRFTAGQLAVLARPLAQAVTNVQQSAGSRGVVITAVLPKTLAMALGWHLAQSTTRFFDRTHLLHYQRDSARYLPIRVHPAQPAGCPP